MSRSLKQQARHQTMQQFQKRREEHLAREARICELVIRATTALLERDQVLTATDRVLAAVLMELDQDDVPAAEVAVLCGLDSREANRLRRIVVDGHDAPNERPQTEES